jgi:hypothetical protein
MLEASLWTDGPQQDLASVVADHRATQVDRAVREEHTPRQPSDTGERNRAPELSKRPGWAWLRLFRRYDEYEQALERAQGEHRDRELESASA